jgi:alpha-L-fucosidase
VRPRPSAAQLAWQRDELAMFLHFGVNTFTDREWGDGREEPAIFNPTSLDARTWARAAKATGFRAMILTAKHHDGFCLWPTRTTMHSVKSSPWRSGQGDLVKEFVDACRAEGLKPGLYLSPWDRNNAAYGDSPKYNDLYVDQLRELLTNYGAIHEVWFDGANGEGPNGKKQEYDWPRFWGEVRQLQPNAVMFSDCGPDVRWSGNENGTAGDPNWSTVNPDVVRAPGQSGVPGGMDMLQHGDAAGSMWRPSECDVSIRPGWFHHPAEDARVKSVDALMNLYLRSVGRNAKLLLNVPPTKDGVLHPTDVERLTGFADRRRAMFAEDLMALAHPAPGPAILPADESGAVWRFDRDTSISAIRLEESIENGQCVSNFVLSGVVSDNTTEEILRGSTIGYARVERLTPRVVRGLRLTWSNTPGARATVNMRAYA